MHILHESGVHDMIQFALNKGVSAEWYVFGSVSRGETSPKDIDILCILKSSTQISKVWQICEPHLLRAPIHLRTLSVKNEKSLNFIRRTSAIAISYA